MLPDLLRATVSNNNALRKDAEKQLECLYGQPGFTVELLKLISIGDKSVGQNEPIVRQSAATIFKNVIKKRWHPAVDDDVPKLGDTDKLTVKQHLIDLMCVASKDVQKQLGEAVSIIAKYDFPEKWQDLLPKLMEKLKTQDLNIVLGVMNTVNSLFKRFRNASGDTDAVMRDLKYCLGFQEVLLQTYVAYGNGLAQCSNSKVQLDLMLETIYQMTRIFYSLNVVDLPEYFEDNMSTWMNEFTRYFTYTNALVVDADEEQEPGLVERIQAAIMENINLYATKYEEEFSSHLAHFTQLIWKLLTELNNCNKNDSVATNAMKFLIIVSGKSTYSHLFSENVLQEIIQTVVVKNMRPTERDEELFEENAFDYIRKDLEGSDQDTRRRCAMELIRGLLKLFRPTTSQLCMNCIGSLMQQYSSSRDWKWKDIAIHILLAVSIMSSTSLTGASELNTNINIGETFNNYILNEFADINSTNQHPMLKADVIKVVYIFRSHLDINQLSNTIIPTLIKYLAAPQIVVHTYAAVAIERILVLRHKSTDGLASSTKITKQHITANLQELFTNLFSIVEKTIIIGLPKNAPLTPATSTITPGKVTNFKPITCSSDESLENEYVMKCVMRVLLLVGTDMLSALELISSKLTAILQRICKNPINPQFNHYLFECIAVMLKTGCEESAGVISKEMIRSNCGKFEGLLFPSFQIILANEISEFVPYVFQILAQLLFYQNDTTSANLSDAYKALFPPLLSPVLWDRKGNIPALIELLQAYMMRGMGFVVSNNFLLSILAIFQKLLSLKSTEQYAFVLLNMLYRYNNLVTIQSHLPTIFQLVLSRMMSNQTPKFAKLFIHMIAVFVVHYQAKPLIDVLNSIQPNMIIMLIQQVMTPQIQNISQACSADPIMASEIIYGAASILSEDGIMSDMNTFSMLFNNILAIIAVLNPNRSGNASIIKLTSNVTSISNITAMLSQQQRVLQGNAAPGEGTDEFDTFENQQHHPSNGNITHRSVSHGSGGAISEYDNAYSKLMYADIPFNVYLILPQLQQTQASSNSSYPRWVSIQDAFPTVCSYVKEQLEVIKNKSNGNFNINNLTTLIPKNNPDRLDALQSCVVNSSK